MRINWPIVAGIFAGCLLYDEIVGHRNLKRFNRNLEIINDLKDGNERLLETVRYLVDKLDRHEVPMDEFDHLVATYLNS